jgi:hypothetical protein
VTTLAAAAAFQAGAYLWGAYQRDKTVRDRMLLQERERATCHNNLRALHAAALAFQRASNRWPDSLAALVPAFLADTNHLVCPLAARGTPLARTFESGLSSRISYYYEFGPEPAASSLAHYDDVRLWRPGMSIRQLREAQIARYGPIVPLVQCGHHFPCPNVAHDGQVYETWAAWEFETAGRANPGQRLPPGWFVQGPLTGSHQASLDLEAAPEGRACVRLDLKNANNGSVRLTQILRAGPYRDHWLKVSAQIAADSATTASLFIYLRDRNNVPLPINEFQPQAGVTASARWTRCAVSTYVPVECVSLSFGLVVRHAGRVWVDDVAVFVDDRPVTGRRSLTEMNGPFHSDLPANLNFELLPPKFAALAEAPGRGAPNPKAVPATPPRWLTNLESTNAPVTLDTATFHHGRASACLPPVASGVSGLRQRFNAEPIQNSRLTVRAWLKREHGGSQGALRISVLDKLSSVLGELASPLPAGDSTDWIAIELSIDIPVNAQQVELSCDHTGDGRLWLDEIRSEYARDGTTQPVQEALLGNTDFEE